MNKRYYGVLALVAILALAALPASAQEVWSGYTFFFEKGDFADWTQEENQDRISPALWFTRADTQGLFNIAQEDTYIDGTSPIDTEWAVGEASDWMSLSFEPWGDWCGWCPPCMIGENSVVHIISEDIYFDIRFETWTEGGAGGGFSYYRAEGTTPAESTNWGAVKSLY